MGRLVELLDYLEAWVHASRETLRVEGVAVTSGREEQDWPKGCAWVTLESASHVGELLVWTSGEVDLGTTSLTDPPDHRDEHYDIQRPGELDDLLARLVRLTAPAA